MKLITTLLASSIVFSLAADCCPCPKDCCPVSEQCCPETFNLCGLTFEAYGECLYMQPNGSNLYYGAQAVGLNPNMPTPLASIASPDWLILDITPDYHFGFEVGLGLRINSSNLDIGMSWERLYGDDSESYIASPAEGVMVGPFFDIGPNSQSYKVAHGKISSRFDAANLTFGKQICFFDDFMTHFYGGAAFARIEQKLHTSYSSFDGSIYRKIETSSLFTGAGPQIGLDYGYRMWNSFFFTGHSALSLLMGQMKNGANYKSATPEAPAGLPQPNVQTTQIPNRVQLIPGFEQKLGFSYVSVWDWVKATFEIGYQCQIYLNAIQTIDMVSQALPADSLLVPEDGVFALGYVQNNSNYMLTGPYGLLGFEF